MLSVFWLHRPKAPLKYTAVHEALDPEYSILKQRLARRLRYEGAEENGVQDMSLVVRLLPPGPYHIPANRPDLI